MVEQQIELVNVTGISPLGLCTRSDVAMEESCSLLPWVNNIDSRMELGESNVQFSSR